MHSEETPNTPPTEGQTVPPEEQIIPTAGLVQEDEQTQEDDAPRKESSAENTTGQAQSLARANPMPIGLAVAFVAGVVVGRIASRR